jgi:hypothetical protein
MGRWVCCTSYLYGEEGIRKEEDGMRTLTMLIVLLCCGVAFGIERQWPQPPVVVPGWEPDNPLRVDDHDGRDRDHDHDRGKPHYSFGFGYGGRYYRPAPRYYTPWPYYPPPVYPYYVVPPYPGAAPRYYDPYPPSGGGSFYFRYRR